jgi:hypothetical protein
MKLRFMHGVTIAAAIVVAAGAPAASAKAKPKDTHATVTVTAPSQAGRAARISIRVTSVFSVVANGAERLTVFVAPPGVACPKTAKPPRGADSLISGEAVDRVLIANALSDRLARSGTWTVCGYLTYGGRVTAHARTRVQVG